MYFSQWALMLLDLPAENYAIKTGVHPKDSTDKNISNYGKAIKSYGSNV